jgi:hypothetical protein
MKSKNAEIHKENDFVHQSGKSFSVISFDYESENNF